MEIEFVPIAANDTEGLVRNSYAFNHKPTNQKMVAHAINQATPTIASIKAFTVNEFILIRFALPLLAGRVVG